MLAVRRTWVAVRIMDMMSMRCLRIVIVSVLMAARMVNMKSCRVGKGIC